MKNFDLGRPIRDGKELSEEEAVGAIDERQVLDIEVADENGLITTFKMLADPSRVSAQMVQDYQTEVTALALRGEQLARLSEKLQAPDESEGGAEIDPALEDQASTVLSDSTALTLKLREAKAKLLAPGVEVWNVPGTERPSIEYLTRRTGVGPAALKVLSDWFFPTTRVAEEETGTTPTPNTDSTSATSQPAPDEENTPPIS